MNINQLIEKQNILKTDLDLLSDITIKDEMIIAGVDISYHKDDKKACVGITVFKNDKLFYSKCKIIDIVIPYVSGFLGFREAPFYMELIDEYNTLHNKQIDVILVDGNGILHNNRFGSACHLGVLSNIPTIGVTKTLYCVDGIRQNYKNELNNGRYEIKVGNELLGVALVTTDESKNPIFVSVGHKIKLDTACKIVLQFCKYRIPEPIRMADINTRETLRINTVKR